MTSKVDTPDTADLLYGVPAIAAHMGIRLMQAHHQIRKGGLPVFRKGGVICARKSSINSWLEDGEAAAAVKGEVVAEVA